MAKYKALIGMVVKGLTFLFKQRQKGWLTNKWLVAVCLPDEYSSSELTDSSCDMLASYHGVVPVTTTTWLIVVVIDHHTTAYDDVRNTQFVTSSWTNVSWRYFYWVTVLTSKQTQTQRDRERTIHLSVDSIWFDSVRNRPIRYRFDSMGCKTDARTCE